jgi:hypothetical protein
MLEQLIPAFSDECAKIAAANPLLPLFKAEAFHSDERKDWNRFEKDLRGKTFQQAMLLHEKTKEDKKLAKYVKTYGGYLSSKNVVGTVPSRTSSKQYKVKKLNTGRLACGCRDWQYKHSWKGTDCDHIRALKASGDLRKTASPFLKGLAVARFVGKTNDMAAKGRATEESVKRLKAQSGH